jgi:hypothetical protein
MRTGHWVTVLATAAAFCLIAFALGMRQTVRQSVPVSPVTTAPVTAPGLSSALGTVPQTGRQVSKAPDVGVGALPTQPALTQEEAEKRRMKDVAQARQYRDRPAQPQDRRRGATGGQVRGARVGGLVGASSSYKDARIICACILRATRV